MADLKIKWTDLIAEPTTVLTSPAVGDYVLIYDASEPLDTKKIKVISYQNLVNLAAQSAVQALVTSQVSGDTFYANGATSIARLAKGTAGQVLTMDTGGNTPEWKTSKGLSCYGYFAASTNLVSGSQTSWTDIPTATCSIVVPATVTLFAIAVATGRMTDVGTGLVRWLLDGTAGQKEANIGSTNVPVDDNFSVLGIKTGVAAGTKTCKLQYKISDSPDTISISSMLGFVLGFAE